MDELKIEKAFLTDANGILKVQKLAFQLEAEIHWNFSIPPLIQTIESIQKEFSHFQFYKAIIGENIIASVKVQIIKNNILWIARLIVHPEYQNLGIGKKLMQFVEDKYNNVTAFELFTAEKSQRNNRFYINMGYVITDKITEPGHSDIILVKLVKNKISGSN